MSLFGKKIKVRVLVSGRIGPGWRSHDQTFALPVGATLRGLLDAAAKDGIDLRAAIADSPHLRHTLMLNGERCPLDDNQERVLADGDELYLLGPIAGG